MKRMLLWMMLVLSFPVCAADGLSEHVRMDTSDKAALRDGFGTFVNYCMGCHGARYQRYERVADDLGIPHETMLETFMFSGARIGDHMEAALRPADARSWFGAVPPDLTLVAKVRGTDWLYRYLRGFYEDPSRPWGVNNDLLPNVGMPNVLAGLQGRRVRECPHPGAECTAPKTLPGTGALTDRQFDAKVGNLVAYLAYSADPGKVRRQRIGTYALLYLVILGVFALLLKREYWKDVR